MPQGDRPYFSLLLAPLVQLTAKTSCAGDGLAELFARYSAFVSQQLPN